ncbi:hypothetical protein AV530_003643 [Patagioenas fasciata monilis]|uniref:Uncharacterized protein n=1 Tax=Patagioenas fasciata monilis TaxID=372326 RepID=A0A1V4KYC4_PATFA|nr:hypothetical protein AV530_003643 [Patagioenas fasciata monilis]
MSALLLGSKGFLHTDSESRSQRCRGCGGQSTPGPIQAVPGPALSGHPRGRTGEAQLPPAVPSESFVKSWGTSISSCSPALL